PGGGPAARGSRPDGGHRPRGRAGHVSPAIHRFPAARGGLGVAASRPTANPPNVCCDASYTFRLKPITQMSASVPTMPEWVTALEAAVLTGASEIVVLDAVRSGRIQANPLSMGKGSSGVLMVRLRDVQVLVEEPSRPAAAASPPPSALVVVAP